MTISIVTTEETYNFGSLSTHQVPMLEPFEFQNHLGRFFGAVGETEIRDEQKGRWIRVPALFTEFVSKVTLEAALTTVDDKANTLHGTLTVDSVTYSNVTFLSLERQGQPFYDGSGVNKWIQRGVLVFRQLKRNSG